LPDAVPDLSFEVPADLTGSAGSTTISTTQALIGGGALVAAAWVYSRDN
jgi:hypothetical protein